MRLTNRKKVRFVSQLFAILSILSWLSCSQVTTKKIINHEGAPEDWIARVYSRHGLSGSFAWMQRSQGRLRFSRSNLDVETGWLSCSTFKIANSIIALEEGVIKDEHHVLKWDGVQHAPSAWNQDQDMQTAFRNSTVWYYRQIARRLSPEKYRRYLTRFAYGNGDLTAGLDRFWLEGGFRVTHRQQINLLKAIDEETLPASRRALEIVKKIMIVESGDRGILRAKTGLCRDGAYPDHPIGWWVGTIETPTDRIYFSSFVTADSDLPGFAEKRLTSGREILQGLKFL